MSVTLSGIKAESTHLSGNPIKITVTTTGIPAGSVNYEILLKVVSTDGKLEGGPFIDNIAPSVNNQSVFDISGYVDQAIDKTFSWPLVGFANPHPNMVFTIWLYPGERYIDSNGILFESFGEVLEPVFIVKGRLPEHLLSEFNDNETNWNEYFCNGRRFFSLMPRIQTVSPWQPVKLWWKTNVLSENLTGIITGTFSDGTTQEVTQPFIAYRSSLIEFDIQPEHMGFNPDDGIRRLEKYTFTIGGETFTFNIDWNYYEHYYYLFADNQICGIECIWLSGKLKYIPTGERTISVKPRETTDGSKVPTLRVSGNKRNRKWMINTGFKPGETKALDILLDSPNTWLALPPASGERGWLNSNYTIIPVIITSSGLELYDDAANGLDNVDLEITEAH